MAVTPLASSGVATSVASIKFTFTPVEDGLETDCGAMTAADGLVVCGMGCTAVVGAGLVGSCKGRLRFVGGSDQRLSCLRCSRIR